MIIAALIALTAVAAPSLAPPTLAQRSTLVSGERYADVVIRQHVIIRVPTREAPAQPAMTRWREKKGPRCLPGRTVAGAVLVAPDKVDFILTGGQRIRARLETSCPALDFYNGFYLRPDMGDGRICAGRDAIHARSGGECQIRRFRMLVPKKMDR